MKRTSRSDLIEHLQEGLGLRTGDLVFLFSNPKGMGLIEGGIDTVFSAFKEVLSEGILINPTFTYSWCNNEVWNPDTTDCPMMGAIPMSAWKQEGAVRTNHPNFSVTAFRTKKNEDEIEWLFDIDRSSFGEGSIFGRIKRYSDERRALILLLGNPFPDTTFRCTFIHHAQQIMKAPYRFIKNFTDPRGIEPPVDQLVRFVSIDEIKNSGEKLAWPLKLPVSEPYHQFGEDLKEKELIKEESFKYASSRLVHVRDCIDVFMDGLRANPLYGLS